MFYVIKLYKIIGLLVELNMRIGSLVVKLVKRYWHEGDMWEVFIKNSESIGFLKRKITMYYAVWSALLRYGKDAVEFKTKREAVEYLVDSDE